MQSNFVTQQYSITCCKSS